MALTPAQEAALKATEAGFHGAEMKLATIAPELEVRQNQVAPFAQAKETGEMLMESGITVGDNGIDSPDKTGIDTSGAEVAQNFEIDGPGGGDL